LFEKDSEEGGAVRECNGGGELVQNTLYAIFTMQLLCTVNNKKFLRELSSYFKTL
jgi:hypothetical protein